MEELIADCIEILKILSSGFGNDNPSERRETCIDAIGSVARYNRAVEFLAEKELIMSVPKPNRTADVINYYPVLNQKTHRFIEQYGAENLLWIRSRRIW